jgi:hypothetical protein
MPLSSLRRTLRHQRHFSDCLAPAFFWPMRSPHSRRDRSAVRRSQFVVEFLTEPANVPIMRPRRASPSGPRPLGVGPPVSLKSGGPCRPLPMALPGQQKPLPVMLSMSQLHDGSNTIELGAT